MVLKVVENKHLTEKSAAVFQNALLCASKGWRVFPATWVLSNGKCSCSSYKKDPCDAPGKHAITAGWQLKASIDLEDIRKWFAKHQGANLGILTGKKSGIFVLDVDMKDDGQSHLDELQARYGELPETVMALTGGGGKHYFFKYPEGRSIKGVARFLGDGIGLDIRSDGELVIGPGSVHKSGGTYEWELTHHPEEMAVADAPEWLLSLIPSGEKPKTRFDSVKKPELVILDGKRNSKLASMAGKMRRSGFSESEIEAALLQANEARCKPPLSNDEVRRIACSVARYEPETEFGSNKLPEIYLPYQKLLTEAGDRYKIDNSSRRLCYTKEKETALGTFIDTIPIANFVPRAVAEVTRDDGREQLKTFTIEGVAAPGIKLPAISVPAKEFTAMGWVASAWGVTAAIEPGRGAADRVRHMIQSTATGVPRQTVYTHLGWRRINDRWVYLHAGGSVGGTDVSVEPGEGLKRYHLPEVGNAQNMRDSLKLLEVAPYKITIPLWSMCFLAPLCEPLRTAGIEPAFVLWLLGQSGAMKSTVAALFLSHYGSFSNKNPPGSFKDSENGLEKRGFLAKDTLLLVDDFHPTANPVDAKHMQKLAQGLLRAYGDRVGRTRMKADTSIREGYPPRGLPIVTGEDTPNAGQSTTARFLAVEVERGSLNKKLLSEAQLKTGNLASAMRSYIEWLAPRLDTLPEKLHTEFIEYRQRAQTTSQHGRIAETVAWLYIGLFAGLSFAERSGVISPDGMAKLLRTGWNTFMELAEAHGQRIVEDRPAERFITIIREVLTSGAGHVRNVADVAVETPSLGFLGWRDERYLYLLPEVAFKTVQQFAQQQGLHFPVSARMLWKHLHIEGMIESQVDNGGITRFTLVRKIGGKTHRLLWLKLEAAQLNDDLLDSVEPF